MCLQVALTVITALELEHVDTLGGSLQSIARAKAGIVKAGGAVVVAEQAFPGARAALAAALQAAGAGSVTWVSGDAAPCGTRGEDVAAQNTRAAVAALDVLRNAGHPVVAAQSDLSGVLRQVKRLGKRDVRSVLWRGQGAAALPYLKACRRKCTRFLFVNLLAERTHQGFCG